MNPLTGMPNLMPNGQKIAKQINHSQLLQAGLLFLGLAATISLGINNYYNIKMNKLKIKELQGAISKK